MKKKKTKIHLVLVANCVVIDVNSKIHISLKLNKSPKFALCCRRNSKRRKM